jgi:putative acetyltransferase
MIVVERGDPRAPAPAALLEESRALMQRLFAAEENHFLSSEALAAPDVRFFVARRGEIALGCAALALRPGYGEVKSMYVEEGARGSGVADALMRAVEDEARAEALPWLRLETGDALVAARRLYARHGFAPRGPFGDYSANATSIFLEKRLG